MTLTTIATCALLPDKCISSCVANYDPVTLLGELFQRRCRQPHALHQICKSGIGAQRVPHWIGQVLHVISSFVSFFQPCERLVFITDKSIDRSNVPIGNATLSGVLL